MTNVYSPNASGVVQRLLITRVQYAMPRISASEERGCIVLFAPNRVGHLRPYRYRGRSTKRKRLVSSEEALVQVYLLSLYGDQRRFCCLFGCAMEFREAIDTSNGEVYVLSTSCLSQLVYPKRTAKCARVCM
jgi:hypothetical protein